MGTNDLSIATFLVEISTRLDAIAARARAGRGYAQSGSENEALRVAMDIDDVIYEVKMLHGAMWLAARSGRDRATS